MTRLGILAPLALLLLSNAPSARRPLPAPAQFQSLNYGVTFHTPAHAFYCPLSPDWVGSDHGTILFLTPPRRCGEAGYPSSGRDWGGEVSAWIEVYYGYWMGEDVSPSPPCNRVGTTRLFGRDRPLCRDRKDGKIILTTTARYVADSDAELALTLVTTQKRLAADLVAFRKMVASARPCRGLMPTEDEKGHRGKPIMTGHGAPCPASAKFF